MRGDLFSIVGEILKYGGSTFVALLAMSIYATTDGIFIGNFVGSDGLAAMALVYPAIIVFMALGILFETGGSAVVSKAVGENKKNLSEQIMRTSYLSAFVIGMIFAIVGSFLVEPLMKLLSDNPDDLLVIGWAVDFVRIAIWGVPFLITIYLTGAFMRSIGQPSHVVYFICSTVCLNIILDALFVIVFGWGIHGAAFATLLAQIAGGLITLWYFKFSRYKFSSTFSLSSFGYVWQEIKIGAGFGFGTLMMFLTDCLLNAALLNHGGADLLSAAAVSHVLLSLALLPMTGLDTGIQPLVSKLFAAKQMQKCMAVIRYDFILTMFISVVIYAVLMIFPEELIEIFLAENEIITAEMIIFVRMMFLFQLCVGVYTWFSGIMAALEDEWRNTLIFLTPLVCQVPAIWILANTLPIEYVALSSSIQDFVEMIIAFFLVKPFLHRNKITFRQIFNAR